MLYGGGWPGSPTPTTPPANGRFMDAWVVPNAAGKLGNRKASVGAGMPRVRMNSGENATVHAGSQNPQNPVPGAYSISVPTRKRWAFFCHVIVSTNVYR